MAEYLRVWLRCCMIFGIYVSSRSERALREPSQRQPTQRRAVWLSEPWRLTFVLERVYVALLALIACILYVHGLYARKIEDGLALTWLVATLVYTTQLLTHLAIFMEALWKRVENETFLQLLAEIEVSLQLRLSCDTRQQALRQSLRRWLLGLVALSLVGVVIFTSVSVLLNDIGYLWHAGFSLLVLRVRILQLLLYACILRHYMECLCFKLRQLVTCRTAPERRLLDVNYEKLESLSFLLAFKENYALIYKAVRLFNNFAGWSLFGIIFGYMLDFTCHVYWSLLGLDGYGSRYTFVVGLPAVLPFSVIVWQLCFGDNISHLVSRLVTVTSKPALKRYCAVVHQFSTQLQLQRIEMTAQHVFVLDLRLIMSICTAIATNLVILIQFFKTEHAYD